MSDQTLIQWCDYTWSPWLGCRKVSPGCDNCYITRTMPFRTRHIKHGAERQTLSEAHWALPDRWNRRAHKDGVRPRVFPSLCDPFDLEVSTELFNEFFSCVMTTQNLDWILLTKRPQNINHRMEEFAKSIGVTWDGFPANVWPGVSVEDQKRAEERIPRLLAIPAKVRVLSVEPLLGPVDLNPFLGWCAKQEAAKLKSSVLAAALKRLPDVPGVDWVIVGGESGPGARPCDVKWVRDVVRQCKAAGVPVFAKQLGAHYVDEENGVCGYSVKWPFDVLPSGPTQRLKDKAFRHKWLKS